MNLNLEIEQGSQADNIGKNLEQSTINLGKDTVMSAGTGAAINLTGEQNLINLASGLENYSQQLASIGLNTPEQLVDILLGTVNNVLSENGVINTIQKGLQVTTKTIDMAKKGLDTACSSATAIANIQKLLTKLNKMQDVEVTCIPSVKDTTSALSASIIQQLTAQYEALKQQLLIFYNSMICTSNDAVLDNIIVSINNILETVEPELDPILQQNTGHTINEVRNICNQGFAYIGMIERAAAAKRKEDEAAKEAAEKQTIEDEEKTNNKIANEASKLGNDLKDQATQIAEETKGVFKKIGTNVSNDVKNMSLEAKEKFKKELIEKSKKKWQEKTKDLSKEEATEKLMLWLKDQSIILQNAFYVLVIKDIIDFIKTFIQQLQNISEERLEICLNQYDDIINIFKKLGIEPGKQVEGITIEDLKKLETEVSGKVVDTVVNIGQQVQNNATGTLNNVNEQISTLTGNATGQAANLVNSGIDVASNMVDSGMNAVSQLSKVDINIDMSAIEQVLQGKILIFDPIVKIIQVLYPGFEAIKMIASLILNYKVNKEFVRTKQHADLAKATQDAAQLVMGLKDIIELKDTNFFTIRTQKMADWASKTFTQSPDENGTITIDIIGTTKLNTYCAVNLISPEYPLDLLKSTTLYYDKWSIENGGYEDGTTQGLDNVEINRELGEVYFDARQRSTISSEILRARKRKIDPNYVKTTEIKTESSSIGDLLNLTEFTSDEIEGQQTLNLCNLNLCPQPSLPTINDNKPQPRSVIIEFGDEYTLGDKVDYNIVVKPGQTINEGDILAYITKGNSQRPIRTKFTGVIRGIDDYTHLYQSAANRHFIIDSPVPCMPVDYNIDDVMDLSKRFKMATELGVFILNCMPLSVLPILLVNANRDNNTNAQTGSVITEGIQETTEVFSKFEEIMSNYNTIIDAFNNNIISLSSIDNFNKMDSSFINKIDGKTYYKIPINKNEEIKEGLMSIRQQMIKTAIDTYSEALYYKPVGDYTYGDCLGLAFDDNLLLTYGIYKENTKELADDKKITNINYYINLLQNIPESKDMEMPPINIDMASINSKLKDMYSVIDANGNQVEIPAYDTSGNIVQRDINNNELFKEIMNATSQQSNNNFEDNNGNFINEYREIIESIISNRLTLERKNTTNIYKYFNEYYSKNILGLFNVIDAFSQLKTKLEEQEYSLDDNTAILNLIKLDKLGKQYDLKDSKDYNNFRKADKDKMKNDKNYYNQCQYVLTIFVYLLHADIEKTIKPLNKILIEYNIESSSQYYTESSTEYSNIDQKRKNNQKYFELIQKESKLILEFWKKVLATYNDPNGKYNLDNVIKDIKGYADKMNSYAKWPTPINIKVDNTNYELYTFADKYEEPKLPPKEIMVPADMGNIEIPDPVIDLNNLPEPRDRDKITIMDYEYWLVYMLNATLFTLIPAYWADGFDIPPFMTPTLLPAIYLPIAPPIMVPVVNVLMVFGIALRGIWPMPIILMINLSSNDIDAMVFIKIALETAKDIFKKSQELVENGIPIMINKIAESYMSENQVAQKAIEKFKTYSSIIHSIPVKDKALIEKKFSEALVDEMNKQAQLNKNNNKSEKSKLKNFDRRQVITRESDLGNGPDPM